MLEQAGPIRTSSSWTVRRALILSTSNPDHQLLETSNTCGMRMTERDDDRIIIGAGWLLVPVHVVLELKFAGTEGDSEGCSKNM